MTWPEPETPVPPVGPLTAAKPTPMEARLIATLRRVSPGRVARADVLAAVWPDRRPCHSALRVLVSKVRDKLAPGVALRSDGDRFWLEADGR